jgi:hypothetical protein
MSALIALSESFGVTVEAEAMGFDAVNVKSGGDEADSYYLFGSGESVLFGSGEEVEA